MGRIVTGASRSFTWGDVDVLVFCSKSLTNEVVGLIGVRSVGLSGSRSLILLSWPDKRRGFGATYGLWVVSARGLLFSLGTVVSGDLVTASCAAWWDGDVPRSCRFGAAKLGVPLCSSVDIPSVPSQPPSVLTKAAPCFGLGVVPTRVAAANAPLEPEYVVKGTLRWGVAGLLLAKALVAPNNAALCESVVLMLAMEGVREELRCPGIDAWMMEDSVKIAVSSSIQSHRAECM